jgi:thiol-disulfide isomerase/thioredoxin
MLNLLCFACVLPFANPVTYAEQQKSGPYDQAADGESQVTEALTTAARQNKHVLLQFGANWCVPCRQLHEMFEQNNGIHPVLVSNFVAILINVGDSRNGHLIDKFHARINFGIPFLIVLDAKGRELTIEHGDDNELGEAKFDEDKILLFLHKWSPKPRPELVSQLVTLFLDKEFTEPVDGNLAEFQPVHDFAADAVPLLLNVITNRDAIGATTKSYQERWRACAALGLLDATLWTNQPTVEKRLLAGKLVDAFTQLLPNSTYDENIFQAIRQIGPDAVPCLMDVIREPTSSDQSRSQAYRALGGLRELPEIVVPFLAEQFNTNEEQLPSVEGAIIDFGVEAGPAIPALTNAFHSSNFSLAYEAAFTLAKVYPDDAELPPMMAEWLRSTDVVHRRMAARVLADLGPASKPATSALTDGARDPDETVRKFSLKALEQIHQAAAGTTNILRN